MRATARAAASCGRRTTTSSALVVVKPIVVCLNRCCLMTYFYSSSDIPPANSTSGAATPVQSASPALQPSPFIPEPCQQTPVTHPITHSHHHRTHLPSISARAPSITTVDSSPAEDVFPSPTITTTPSADQSPASLVKAPSGHSKSKTLTHESSSSPAAKKRSSKEHHRKSNSRENSVVSTSATGEVEKSLSRHSSGKRRKNSVASTPTATPSDSASVSIANSAEIPPPSDLPPVFDGVTSDGLVPPSDLPPVWATPRLEVEENRPVLSDADLASMEIVVECGCIAHSSHIQR